MTWLHFLQILDLLNTQRQTRLIFNLYLHQFIIKFDPDNKNNVIEKLIIIML